MLVSPAWFGFFFLSRFPETQEAELFATCNINYVANLTCYANKVACHIKQMIITLPSVWLPAVLKGLTSSISSGWLNGLVAFSANKAISS